jgi:hypothetical protein
VTHPLIAGIQNHIGRLIQGAGAPGLQSFIEQCRTTADLRAGDADLRPHQLLQDGDQFTGGDALHVHLGQRQIHSLFAAAAPLQCTGIEASRAHLRHLKGELAQAGQNCLGFVAIGVVQTLGRTLIRCRLKVLGALDAGRFVDEDAQGFASAVKAVGEQAGVRLMHWVVNVVKLDSLGHGETLSLACSSRANQSPGEGLRRPGRGLN